jgi:hypothetical protein
MNRRDALKAVAVLPAVAAGASVAVAAPRRYGIPYFIIRDHKTGKFVQPTFRNYTAAYAPISTAELVAKMREAAGLA